MTRKLTISLLSRGLVTMAEAAEMLGTSRQRIRYWCRAAGIDPVARRQQRLEKLFNPNTEDDN